MHSEPNYDFDSENVKQNLNQFICKHHVLKISDPQRRVNGGVYGLTQQITTLNPRRTLRRYVFLNYVHFNDRVCNKKVNENKDSRYNIRHCAQNNLSHDIWSLGRVFKPGPPLELPQLKSDARMS